MQHSSDVVVIGGGVIGCALAYHLSREGVRVTLLEKESLACQASGVAAGLLNPLSESDGPSASLGLSLQSLALHHALTQELQQTTGIPTDFSQTPILQVAFTPEEGTELRQTLAWKQGHGLRVSWADARELLRLEPQLSPEVCGGLYSQDEAQLEAYPYVLALARGAELQGAQVVYTTVTGIHPQRDRSVEIDTPRGPFSAGAAVIALGPWSPLVQEWLGVQIPVEPVRGQILRVLPPHGPMSCIVFSGGDYIAPKPNGSLLMGTTEEHVDFDKTVTEEGRRHIVEVALRLAPGLRDAAEVYAIAGLRPFTPDNLPIIGAVPQVENVYLATGHGRRGVLQSAATGQAIADLIIRGETDLPIDGLSPQRFQGTGN